MSRTLVLKFVMRRHAPIILIYISFDVDSLDCDLVSKGTELVKSGYIFSGQRGRL